MEEKKLKRKKEQALSDNNQEQLAIALSNLGDYYNQQGRYDDAVREYKEESEIYNELNRKLEMAKANRMVGEMYMLLSEFENALKYVAMYLGTVKELGNKIEEQRAYATLGRAHLLHGQSLSDKENGQKPLKRAEKAFIKSLLICKELSGQISKIELFDMQARLYLNIGVVKEHLEDFEESITYMEKAIKISKTNDLYELLHLCYMSVSLLYHYKMNDMPMALKFCNLALEIATRLSDRVKKQCETLIVKSEIMIKMGDFQSAKQILHKAYKLKTPNLNDQQIIEKNLKIVAALCITLDNLVSIDVTNYEERKKLYETMGDGCCLLENYKKAIDYYLQMLDNGKLCCKTEYELIPIYVSLYQTYKDDKQYDKALEYLWKEYELNKNEPIEAFNTLCNIAEINELQLKSFWTIYDIYQKAINEARKIDNRSLEKIALMRLMKLEQKFNMQTLAENLKEEAETRGIDLNEESDHENDDNVIVEENNTPDIGADICLEDLTDSDSENENINQVKNTRRRRTGMIVKRNNKGETQLHQACISGNINLVRRLIDQGHPINVRDHAGWLPLHEACNHGYRDIVEILLERGGITSINDKGGTSCDGITPIYDACSNGYLDVVELLLEKGANATLKTDFGDTTLNVLDKWRNSVDNIDNYEQIKYERIRSKLVDHLNKAGLLEGKPDDSINKNIDEDIGECSLEKLRKLAYGSDDDDNDDEIKKISFSSYRSGRRSINDKDENETIHNKRRQSFDLKNLTLSRKKSSAANEYKSVMQNLKHPNRQYVNTDEYLNDNENRCQQKRKSGFLDPDEVEDDDWLEDDMATMINKKKRKFFNDPIINKNEYKSGDLVSPMTDKNNLELLFDSDYDDEGEKEDAFQVLLESRGKQNMRKKSKSSVSSNRYKTLELRKQQSTLIDNGFSRCTRTENRLSSSESSVDGKIVEPDSTTINNVNLTASVQNISNSTISNVSNTMVSATVPFKIKIENELLLVPVDKNKINELNILWLAEEASRRYYNIVGMKPILRLMTSDGFAFEESDTLNVALQENSILAKVIEWNILPLVQRYEEICIKLDININENIKKVLEKAQTTNYLILKNSSITHKTCEPIFKSIQHHTNLRILNLSNNFLGNDGLKLLSKSLITLKQLKSLHLEGNCITYIGINHVIKIFDENNITNNLSVLQELEELNLSYNPLNDNCMEYLYKLCKNLNKLKKLYLSSCNLTKFYEYNLNFNQLTNIDVSFNQFNKESLKFLLMNLNSSYLEYINLNNCYNSNNNNNEKINSEIILSKILFEFFKNGTCENFKYISLQGCTLNDSDIYKIVQLLSNSVNLNTIDLSLNTNLTTSTIQYIIDKIPFVSNLYLRKCSNIYDKYRFNNFHFNYNNKFNKLPIFIAFTIDNENISNNYEIYEVLNEFWKKFHGDKSKIKIIGNNVELYTN